MSGVADNGGELKGELGDSVDGVEKPDDSDVGASSVCACDDGDEVGVT
jgi:hypothetical protein